MILRVNCGGEGEVEVEEERGERTKINRDVVDGGDGGLKLRSPSKIMFDIGACNSDNELKFCIILKVI